MLDTRTVYIYVVCNLKIKTPKDEEPAVQQAKHILEHILDDLKIKGFFHIKCPNCRNTAGLLSDLSQLNVDSQDLPPLQVIPENLIPATEAVTSISFGGLATKLNQILRQGLGGQTLGQALGLFPPLYVLQGVLKNLLAQYAMSLSDHLYTETNEQSCNLLMVLPLDMAGLACQDMCTVLPQHGDVICYEMCCFPDGSVHLHDSRVLPNNAKP